MTDSELITEKEEKEENKENNEILINKNKMKTEDMNISHSNINEESKNSLFKEKFQIQTLIQDNVNFFIIIKQFYYIVRL